MKRVTGILLILIFLVGCGSSYEEEVQSVIEKENKRLKESTNEENVDSLKREDANIAVYDDGKYILISYMIRSDYKADFIYEKTDNSYEVNASRELEKELSSMDPDYSEGENNG